MSTQKLPLFLSPAPAERLTALLRVALRALRDQAGTTWGSAPRPALTPHDELVELDARTLEDIGAPEPLLSRALARRETRRRGHDDLRNGLEPGGWSGW